MLSVTSELVFSLLVVETMTDSYFILVFHVPPPKTFDQVTVYDMVSHGEVRV